MPRPLMILVLAVLAVPAGCGSQDASPQPRQPQAQAPAPAAGTSNPATASATAPPSPIVSGPVAPDAVVDGDTISLQGRRIRLHGIDAPEIAQTCEAGGKQMACGVTARNALIGFTMGTTVRCERQDVDRYGRDVSRCLADGFDVSAGLVRTGLAVAYREYSTAYIGEEETARRARRGMWKGTFIMPWDWRRRH